MHRFCYHIIVIECILYNRIHTHVCVLHVCVCACGCFEWALQVLHGALNWCTFSVLNKSK